MTAPYRRIKKKYEFSDNDIEFDLLAEVAECFGVDWDDLRFNKFEDYFLKFFEESRIKNGEDGTN